MAQTITTHCAPWHIYWKPAVFDPYLYLIEMTAYFEAVCFFVTGIVFVFLVIKCNDKKRQRLDSREANHEIETHSRINK
jgi:hypothetical protein